MTTHPNNTPSGIWFRSLNRYELAKMCTKYKFKEGQQLTDEQIATMYEAENSLIASNIPYPPETTNKLPEEVGTGITDKIKAVFTAWQTERDEPNGGYYHYVDALNYDEVAKSISESLNLPELLQENKELKAENERLKELERSFYVDICRAYNAGKEAMNNQHTAALNGDPGGNTAFVSSHDYFISEFPTFKTNVP